MRAVPRPAPETLRGLLGMRVVVVSTLLLSALLIQLTFSIWLPLNPIYYLAAASYSTSLLALVTLRRLDAGVNAVIQILGDLVVVTGLVWISGGPDSGFTFLYLAVVVSGTLLFGKGGGLVTAGLASVFYAVLLQLMHSGAFPPPSTDELPPRIWTRGQLAGNVVTNVGAFAATALLVAAASEKLRDARLLAERRREEVTRLQALHTSVLSSMSSGVVTADPEGRITFANPPACELLRRRPEELIGRPLVETGLISDEAIWPEDGAGGDVLRFEGNQTPLGPGVYFGVTVTPLRDGDGRVTGRILIFQNLTELKKLEGEVRLKEKLAAVGELAAAIAHEIRNPLASISGSVQVLSGTAPPGSSERRLMEIVVQESHRLSSILEDFLKYVRPREQAIETVDARRRAARRRDAPGAQRRADGPAPRHARPRAGVRPPQGRPGAAEAGLLEPPPERRGGHAGRRGARPRVPRRGRLLERDGRRRGPGDEARGAGPPLHAVRPHRPRRHGPGTRHRVPYRRGARRKDPREERTRRRHGDHALPSARGPLPQRRRRAGDGRPRPEPPGDEVRS